MSQVSPQDSGYKFGATYIGTKQFSPSEVGSEDIHKSRTCQSQEISVKFSEIGMVFRYHMTLHRTSDKYKQPGVFEMWNFIAFILVLERYVEPGYFHIEL